MRRRHLIAPALAALLAFAPAASASPDDAATADAAAAEGAAPSEARAAAATGVSIRLGAGLRDRGRLYVMQRQIVPVRGRVTGAPAGTPVTVSIWHGGEEVREIATTTRSDGTYSVRFKARPTGRFTVRAHVGDDSQEVVSSGRARVSAIAPRARPGSRGTAVRLLQRGLRNLAYVTPRSGRFDPGTGRALIAFRKANRMRRIAAAGSSVFWKVFHGRGGVRLKHPNWRGRHVEYDWSRQILILAYNGKPFRIYHSSSGTAATPTVFGIFRFYRRQWGTNSLGMVHSVYFIRGYAIHGFKSVPIYPASHGCLRVPIPNALSIARWIKLGDRIHVYR